MKGLIVSSFLSLTRKRPSLFRFDVCDGEQKTTVSEIGVRSEKSRTSTFTVWTSTTCARITAARSRSSERTRTARTPRRWVAAVSWRVSWRKNFFLLKRVGLARVGEQVWRQNVAPQHSVKARLHYGNYRTKLAHLKLWTLKKSLA